MAEKRTKTALVLAGGGIMGAAYEIGCLTALNRLFSKGFSCSHFDMYIGISAGSVIATLMANRVPPALLFRDIARDSGSIFNWRRRDIYRFDTLRTLSSSWLVLRNMATIYRSCRQQSWELSFQDFFHIIQEQFPAGLFSLSPMQQYLCKAFAKEGVIDNFNLLERELYIPAYDLDTGARVVFGSEEFRNMHICQAITASCAIPFFFHPPRIRGRHYLDGSTGRVTHLDIAIERGANLIVIVNPRVPMQNDMEHSCLPSLSFGKCSSIAELGISLAWEQAKRIEIKEKLDHFLETHRRKHPDIEFLLLEPGQKESLLFFQSPMSNIARHHIMNYGYHLTMGQLRERYTELKKIFERCNIDVTDSKLGAAPPAELVT